MRDEDNQDEFFEQKSNEIYRKLLHQHNEGLDLIYIAKEDGMFGVLRNFNCNDIENGVTYAEKIGIAVKIAAVWTAGGFMKQCIAEVKEPEAKWKMVLGITLDIIDIVLGIVLSIFTFGVWKYIRTTLSALRALYYFYKAFN